LIIEIRKTRHRHHHELFNRVIEKNTFDFKVVPSFFVPNFFFSLAWFA